MFRHRLTRLLTWAWVLACASPVLGQLRPITSIWLDTPPVIDGILDQEWSAQSTRAASVSSPHASVFFANDLTMLYCFVDVLGDNVDDPRDLLSIIVDLNRDNVLNRGDWSFQLGSQLDRTGILVYTGNGWSPAGPLQDTRYATVFGGARSQFRHWEVAIPLARLRARPGEAVNLALRMTSGQPLLESWLPQNQMGGVSSFLKLQLVTPTPLAPPTPLIPPTPLAASEAPLRAPAVQLPSVKMTPQGLKRTNPDGSSEILTPAVDVVPPDPPSVKQEEWLQTKAAALLGVIRKLVNGDEASVNAYLTVYESGTPSAYWKVQTRIWMIQQLVGSGG